MRALLAGFVLAGACFLASRAGAQVDMRALGRALADAEADGRHGSAFLRSERFSAIIRLPDGIDGREQGLSFVAPGWAAVRGPARRLAELANEHPEWKVSWQPPLQLLLDRAGELTGAPAYRAETNRTGQGVVVGIVDTGVDVYHDDLRNPDGTTRIAWLIDMMGEPQGVHASVEARCNEGGLSCGVYSAAAIDAMIVNNERPDVARDPAGHGTHIASLAAGNGRASNGLYIGVAPEASLIVARVASGAIANIEAVDVLKAVELIYWLAQDEPVSRGLPPMPAVVNVSLGSDLGPHDGSAPFAEGLAALVGDEHLGRALVVAAGNSGTLYDTSGVYPNPLGVHTEVHVTPHSSVRVPLLTYPPPFPSDTPYSSVFIWIEFRPGDRISVGLERASSMDGTVSGALGLRSSAGETGLVAPGETLSRDDGLLSVTVLNGALAAQGFRDGMDAAFVAIEGEWPAGEEFAVRLEGHGTATLWVQTEGDIAPSAGGLGALFPAATPLMTITNPAVHPDLIAVGATINRSSWTDRTGQEVTVEIGGSTPTPDAVAFFSSAGPNGAGRIKPDLVAPGGWVIGALSRDADPARSVLSIFGTRATCDPVEDCAVVDATHAVTAGTSMAAPMVAGAAALLFEGAPQLTQRQVRTRLQAGAKRLARGASPQQGAGALDMLGALAVEGAELSGAEVAPSAERSWMVTSNVFARPDSRQSVHGLLQLRSADGLPADGFEERRLSLEASTGVVREVPTRLAPGLWRFEVAAADGSGGDDLVLQARFDGEPLLTERLPIAVDVHVAEGGFSAEGGCTMAAHKGSLVNAAHLLLALGLWIMRIRGVRRHATGFDSVSSADEIHRA